VGRPIAFVLAALALLAIGSVGSSCAEGGRVIGQRTFLWHVGDSLPVPELQQQANPFRGRVAPSKLRGFPLGGDSPDALRHFSGDPTAPLGGLFEPLLPVFDRVLNAPDTVLTDIAGIQLNLTFPSDFGGDGSGEIFCVNPFSEGAQLILSGQIPPPGGSARCIRGSTDTATGEVYTEPSIIKMTGGTLELPFRPGPDRGFLEDPSTNDPQRAQGLFYPTRGMRLGMTLEYERNVDLVTGRPLVARIGMEDLGSCGVFGGDLAESNPDFVAPMPVYSTSFASHSHSTSLGGFSRDAAGNLIVSRGGIGRDVDCLRPGGSSDEPNGFSFEDTEDDLPNTNALENHHANQSLFARLCAATGSYDPWLDPASCLFQLFGSQQLPSEQFLRIPFVELLTSLLAGEQTGANGGPQQFLSLVLTSQKSTAADITAPIASLNRLPNPAAAPIFDRNGDNVIDATGCDDPDPSVHLVCDLAGFDGFDTRADPFDQVNFSAVVQTLDDTLTNEQRALGGCGPHYGTRCDSSTTSGIYGAYGGLDWLNAEASAWLEAIPEPGATASTTSAAAQPGTVGFTAAATCMRRNIAGQLVRLPGCRGVASIDITTNASGEPNVVEAIFDAGYLPSLDGCVIGSQIRRSNGDIVTVSAQYAGNATAAENQLLARELALCNTARTRVPVPEFELRGFLPDGTPDQDPVRSARCVGQSSGGTWDGIDHSLCQAEEVTLEQHPLIHPLAGCVESDRFYAGGGNGQGGCEFYYARDLVEEFLDGRAQLFRSELAAASWNLGAFLVATSCSRSEVDGIPSVEQALRNDPTCYDFENPHEPGRCSFSTPQLCQRVTQLFGLAPPIAADGSVGDDDGDGVTADGDGSGIAGDAPCNGTPLGCDDNCADLDNTGQVNSNGGASGDPFGNLCDPDLDNDGDVDSDDRTPLLECFQTGSSASIDCADADLVGGSLREGPDPNNLQVDGFDRLQQLRWLRDPTSVPGQAPAL
jgi:hypothetical protein